MPKRPKHRSSAVDALIAGSLFVLVVLSALTMNEPATLGTRPLDALLYFLLALQTLPLAWRRSYPVTVLGVVIVGFVVEAGLGYAVGSESFGMAFGLYSVGALAPDPRSTTAARISIGVVVLWTGVGVFALDTVTLVTVLGMAAFTMIPYVLGREARKREERVIDAEARAVRAEMERERDAEHAVRDERTRIARELHDVVAHEMTVMTVQAAAAGRVVDDDPRRARAAMSSVEDAGHRGLTEMRRMLGLLRGESDETLEPQPGLGSLDRLAKSLTEAGLPVEVSVEGDPIDLPVGLDLSIFRIIQEALTNSAKHGGPDTRAEVTVAYRADRLDLEVRDDGRGVTDWAEYAEPGHGLIGMRERVALLDGSLDVGPASGGGHRVRASLPIPPS